jgi:alpha/beta superfamily hydrolase
MKEQLLTFTANNQDLLAISHLGSEQNSTGVLIVVGGPQYRVGSHRQFVQVSRALAKKGISSMRFDYTGMGDSCGEKNDFDNICDDIKAATDAFLKAQSHLKNIVIWGLCDASSAALI